MIASLPDGLFTPCYDRFFHNIVVGMRSLSLRLSLLPRVLLQMIMTFIVPDKEWYAKEVFGYDSRRGPIYFRRGTSRAHSTHVAGEGVLHIFAGIKGWPATVDDLDHLMTFESKVLPEAHVSRRRGLHSCPIGYLAIRLLEYEALTLKENLARINRTTKIVRTRKAVTSRPAVLPQRRWEYCDRGEYCTRVQLCRFHRASIVSAQAGPPTSASTDLDACVDELLAEL